MYRVEGACSFPSDVLRSETKLNNSQWFKRYNSVSVMSTWGGDWSNTALAGKGGNVAGDKVIGVSNTRANRLV